MSQLNAPSKELAERLLAKQGYEGRLLGCQISPWSGCEDFYLFSLEEAARFLDADPDVLSGMDGFMRIIEPSELITWTGQILGDPELAGSIHELMRESDMQDNSVESYRLKIAAIKPIKALLLSRIGQCREVLGQTMLKEVH